MSDPKRVVKLAKMFQDVLDVAKDLNEIGNLEQATRNADTNRFRAVENSAMASASLGMIQEALGVAKDDLKVAERGAEDTIALARQTAQEIVAEAEGEAKDVIRKALETERLVADRVVADQERHAASMRGFAGAEGVARAKVDTIEAELGDLRERIG